MKISYLLILILCFSCKKQHNETPQIIEVKDKTETDFEAPTTNETLAETSQLTLKEVLEETTIKTLPHIETTNFDDFIDPDDYKEVDTNLFQLERIYPSFHQEGYNYRAIRTYSLPLHEDFYSVVITIRKGMNEMESVLVNYSKEGDIIDHKVVSYDEIAEGWSSRVSRISKRTLTTNYIKWFDDKEIQQIEYTINNNGKITEERSEFLHKTIPDYHLINSVLEHFELKWIQLKTNLITSKTLAESPEKTVIVLPRVTDEEEGYTQLKVDIVVANNDLENNNRKYIKSQEPMALTSDAVQLRQLKIDDTTYAISEDSKAYGIRAEYSTSSQIVVYENETLSLFVSEKEVLKTVLNQYDVKLYTGEWENECTRATTSEKKRLQLSDQKTNGIFDISVQNEMTTTQSSFKDENATNSDCDMQESKIYNYSTLKFENENYVEYKDADSTLFGVNYFKFQPEKIEPLIIPNFQVNSVYALGSFKVLSAFKDIKDDKDTTWGDRLLTLNKKNEIIYQSSGVGDPYLFQPHFFKNNTNDKTIVICQMAFEYPFGGEAFLFDNGTITYMGKLDIEGYDLEQSGEKYLTEIVKINERANAFEFTFNTNNLVLNPGDKDQTIVENDNVKYVYKRNKLSLERN